MTSTTTYTDQEFAQRHNIGPEAMANLPETMYRLYQVLVSAVKTVKEGGESNALGVKKAQEIVSSNDGARERAAMLADEIRRLIFSTLQQVPEVAVLLPEHLQLIGQEVRDVRSLVMSGMDIPEAGEQVDTSEARAEAEWAKRSIERFATLLPTFGFSLDTLHKDMLKKNDKGEIVLDLPRLPNSPGNGEESTSAVGRDAKVYRMTFTLNGQPVPDRIGFDRLAIWYCSTVTNRMNGSDLKDTIKRQTGKEWSAQEEFEVKVPAGKLNAKLVKQ